METHATTRQISSELAVLKIEIGTATGRDLIKTLEKLNHTEVKK